MPQIIGYYIKGNLAIFAHAGSAIEETANAMRLICCRAAQRRARATCGEIRTWRARTK